MQLLMTVSKCHVGKQQTGLRMLMKRSLSAPSLLTEFRTASTCQECAVNIAGS